MTERKAAESIQIFELLSEERGVTLTKRVDHFGSSQRVFYDIRYKDGPGIQRRFNVQEGDTLGDVFARVERGEGDVLCWSEDESKNT